MKINRTKLCAALLAMLMILSCILILVTAAQPSTYSKVSNSGIRGEWCLSLDGTSASSYYTGNYSYDHLSSLSSGNLKTSLHNLMTNTHSKITSYSDCRDYVFRTDCENNNTNNATTLYTDYSMTSSDWSPSWACNREHVWPQSLGGGNTSGGGADLHHIRPAEAGVNSSRGNKPYGESTGKGFYEPADYAKGDVARIVLYVYVRWGSAWGADSVTEVFESVDILLAWCELDPVDTWEMGRNEVVQSIQGNRNVFIDYPELAWLLFGKAVPEGMATPSGSALNGTVPTPPAVETDRPTEAPTTGGGTVNPPSDSGNQLAVFDFGANGGASHNDGTDITGSKSYTNGGYTLTLTSPTKLYGDARDGKGNSCLKMGSSKATGSFTFTVPNDVSAVVIHAAGYKANQATVSVNGTRHSVPTCSNDGAYTPITVDTSANKTVTVATVSGSTRCMINTIEFVGAAVTPDTDPPATEKPTEAPTEPTTEPVTEPQTETPTEPVTEPQTETPTEPVTEPQTETPTEPVTEPQTETPTEPVTEPQTETPTNPQTEMPTGTDETPETLEDTDAETDAPKDNGCSVVITGGTVVMSVLCIGALAVVRKKRED